MASVDGELTRSQEKALNCWTHAMAHLVDAFGEKSALNLMAPFVLQLHDRVQLQEEIPASRESRDGA